MIAKILIAVFVIVFLLSFVIRTIIFYHFRKFSLFDDLNPKRILNVYGWGIIIISLLAVFFLIMSFKPII